MEIHELSSMFPKLGDDEIKELAEDIKANGLRNPIVLFEGKILDGKSRYEACLIANVEPVFRQFNQEEEGSVISFVLSENIHRRHLTKSQIVALLAQADDYRAKFEREAFGRRGTRTDLMKEKGNMVELSSPKFGKATDHLGKKFGVSGRYIRQMDAVKNTAPEYVPLISMGKMTVPQAVKEIQRREEASQLDKVVSTVTDKYDLIYVDLPNNSKISLERLDEIGYHVREVISHDSTMLFFWCHPANLRDIIQVVDYSWKFTYRTCMIWDTITHKQGKYFNANHELLLIFSKGSPIYPIDPEKYESIQRIEADGNTRPEEFLHILAHMYPKMSIIKLGEIISTIGDPEAEIENDLLEEDKELIFSAENRELDDETKEFLDKYKAL